MDSVFQLTTGMPAMPFTSESMIRGLNHINHSYSHQDCHAKQFTNYPLYTETGEQVIGVELDTKRGRIVVKLKAAEVPVKASVKTRSTTKDTP